MKTCVWVSLCLGIMILISGCSRPADNQPVSTPPDVSVGEEATSAPPAASVKPDEPVAPSDMTQPAGIDGPAEVPSPTPETKPDGRPEAKPELKLEEKAEASEKKAEEGQDASGASGVVQAVGRALLKGFTRSVPSAEEPPAGKAPESDQ